jgi:acyl dehydratase
MKPITFRAKQSQLMGEGFGCDNVLPNVRVNGPIMSKTSQSDQPRVEYRLVYWEDLINAPSRRYGPVVFTSKLLDQLLELMGEKHPVHKSDVFAQSTARKRRIIPGGFIQSFTSGWSVQQNSPAAIVGLRSVTWDFIRPLYPDEPFFFTNSTVSFSEVDDRLGLVTTERRVFNENEQLCAVGRMNVVLLRREAGASRAAEHGQPAAGESDSKEGDTHGS